MRWHFHRGLQIGSSRDKTCHWFKKWPRFHLWLFRSRSKCHFHSTRSPRLSESKVLSPLHNFHIDHPSWPHQVTPDWKYCTHGTSIIQFIRENLMSVCLMKSGYKITKFSHFWIKWINRLIARSIRYQFTEHVSLQIK